MNLDFSKEQTLLRVDCAAVTVAAEMPLGTAALCAACQRAMHETLIALLAKLQARAVVRRALHQQLMYWDPAHLERRIAAGVFGA